MTDDSTPLLQAACSTQNLEVRPGILHDIVRGLVCGKMCLQVAALDCSLVDTSCSQCVADVARLATGISYSNLAWNI